MADDLNFPESDDLTFVDFGSNLLGEDLRSDIVPLIPNPEFHIPQIFPPTISHAQQQRTFNNLAVNNSINNVNTVNNVSNSYQPISQLMKQTQELASTLDAPLNSNINNTMNYNNQLDSSYYVNQQPVPKNSQYLVVGGQRIQIPASQQSQLQQQQNTQSSVSLQSTLLDAAHSGNLTNSNFLTFNPPRVNNVRSVAPQSQTQPQTHQQTIISQNTINIQNTNQQPSSINKLSNSQGVVNMTMNSQANNPSNAKQPIVVKVPPNQQGQQPTQKGGQFKGSIIKTADQQLMFVTEVNGKKVGYVIQQSKQPQNALSLNNLSTNIPSPGIPSPKAPSPGIPSPILLAPSPSSSISSDSPLPQMLGKNSISIQEIDVAKLNQHSPVQMNTLCNSPVSNFQDIDLGSKKVPKEEIDKYVKKEEMGKTLRERLQGFGTSLKNSVNLKTGVRLPNKSTVLTNPDRMVVNNLNQSRVIQVNTVTQQVDPVSRIISDFDRALPDNTANADMNFEEEEGQEIEFSETDLTTDLNEDSDEPVITAVRGLDSEEMTDLSQQVQDDEDSDSLPLALLKNEETIPIVCEKGTPEKAQNKTKKTYKRSTSDSLPLSVVAASLKKSSEQGDAADGPKKKKRTRKKKKDDDAPVKPIFSYQLFFREVQHKLKEENPMYKENFGELSKKIGHLWEVLDPEKKKAYQDNYAAAKAEYNIKLAEYNEKKAKEAELAEILSPSSSLGDENSRDKSYDDLPNHKDADDDEDAPLKRSTKKKTPAKKPNTQLRKKLTATTIATTTTLSPPPLPEDLQMKEEPNDTPSPEAMEVDGGIPTPTSKASRKTKTKKTSSADSPSPPSSDTNTSDEDDEDDHISRIRLLAASASKQLRKIEKKTSVKGKAKEIPGGNKRGGRVFKMEVETLSEKVVIEHQPPPVFDVKPPAVEEELTPSPPSPPLSKMATRSEPAKVATSPTNSKVSTRTKERSSKPPSKETIASKEKQPKPEKQIKEGIDKPLKIEKLPKKSEKPTSPTGDILSPASQKLSFKIPKRTHGENGPVIPQGPKLCVRESCQNPVKTTRERGGQYCSNDCLVLYCREVFDSWVFERQSEETVST